MIKKTHLPDTHSIHLDLIEVGVMKRSFDRKLSKVSMNQSDTITKMAIDQAVILNKVTNVESRVKSIEEKLDKDYVTQDQFMPIQKVVYGLVAIILTSVFGGLVALVVIK